MQTRGRKTRKQLAKTSGYLKYDLRYFSARDYRAIFEERGEKVPDDAFFSLIKYLISHQDAQVNAGHKFIKTDSEEFRKLRRVINAARKIQHELSDMRKSEMGQQIWEAWANESYNREKNPTQCEADEIFSFMLNNLVNYEKLFLLDGQPKLTWHFFIRQIRDSFNQFDIALTLHENSVFLKFLVELENHFPGLVFPESTVSTARFDYIRSALGNSAEK